MRNWRGVMKFAKRNLATYALVFAAVQVHSNETQELAKASQNPVGNIISLPLEDQKGHGSACPTYRL